MKLEGILNVAAYFFSDAASKFETMAVCGDEKRRRWRDSEGEEKRSNETLENVNSLCLKPEQEEESTKNISKKKRRHCIQHFILTQTDEWINERTYEGIEHTLL